MTELDELISIGNEIARELYAHLQDSSQPLMTHWDTLSNWHETGSAYVSEHLPHSFGRVKSLNVLDDETKIYSSVDSLLRVLRAIGAANQKQNPPAAILPAHPGPEARRGWRRIMDIPVTLLRDPVWQGIGVFVAVVIAIVGALWAS